jgi:hypothetical protein
MAQMGSAYGATGLNGTHGAYVFLDEPPMLSVDCQSQARGKGEQLGVSTGGAE